MSQELHYKWADIPAEEYGRDLDELWSELQNPQSALSREVTDLGIDAGALRGVAREDALSVRTEGEGFDSETVAIVVAIAPLATAAIKALAPVIQDVWKEVLLPRIRQRKGGEALIPKE